MADRVQIRSYGDIPLRRREILRWAGCRSGEAPPLLEECLELVAGKLRGQVCWRLFPVTAGPEELDLGFLRSSSLLMRRRLTDCGQVLVFAATVGLEIDRLITKYGLISPARALFLQAIGAEAIESLCDCFCRDMARELSRTGECLRPRFSPGYGDLPLETQRRLFAVLDCPRSIGLTLNDSLIMSPSKSVTALAGVSRAPGEDSSDACSSCSDSGCPYRG